MHHKLACGWLGATALAACAAGCAQPRGNVSLIDLNFRKMDTEVPDVQTLATPLAYWWEDAGRLCVAFGYDKPSMNKLDRQAIDASLVLDGMPAGTAREYEFDARGLRAYHHDGANHDRFRSLRGVAVVQRVGDAMHVRFRVLALKEMFHILTGWNPIGETLLVAEFDAASNRAAGEPILTRSEDQGMGREAVSGPPTPPAPKGMGRPVRVR